VKGCKNKIFFGSRHAIITIGKLNVRVAQHAPHVLNKLNLDMQLSHLVQKMPKQGRHGYKDFKKFGSCIV